MSYPTASLVFLAGLLAFTGVVVRAADPSETASTEPATSSAIVKTAEDFSGVPWMASPWNNVDSEITLDKSAPPDSKSASCLKVTIHFSGNGDFQHHEVVPPHAFYFPGATQKITIHFKNDGQSGAQVNFVDGWGHTQGSDGQPMVWYPKVDMTPNQWSSATFDVPAAWVQPIGIEGLTSHNYDFKTQKVNRTFWVGDIVIQTDMSQVDPATGDLKSWKPETNPADKDKALKQVPPTPLVTVGFSTGAEGNVFSDTTPSVNLRVGNMKPGVLTGIGTFSVTDQSGKPVADWTEKMSVDSSASFHHDIATPRYGLYTLKAAISLSDGTKFNTTTVLARIPSQKPLTDEQKLASRYGLDVHYAANPVHFFSALTKAGLYWARDYAWSLEWMSRAKGPDRRYAGWPDYQGMTSAYEKSGMEVVPILASIDPPGGRDGKKTSVGPTDDWTRNIADIILSFPSVPAWEVDNEYDINLGKTEKPLGDNFLLYHKKFGDLISTLGGGKLLAMENGRASIFPKDVERFVKSGSYDNINVINFHHYAGTEPPEINIDEYNSGDHSEKDVAGNFFDLMRATRQAASADGKKRQVWLTEFGWDTKAGPIVSNEEEAAFLQRGYLLAFAAGLDKAFWYCFLDEAGTGGFFAGCGLFTHEQQPKLSFAAVAGLTSILPRPVYIGRINEGSNTWGYVFENDGKLVAGLWSLQGKGPKVTFQSGQLSDYLGNKLDGMIADLTIAPVYDIGLSKSDPLYLQTAYELTSLLVAQTMPGESNATVITVTNNRDKPIQATVEMTLPAAWTSPQMKATASVEPGQHVDMPFSYTVNPDEPVGNQTISYACQESGATIKTITSTVIIPRPYIFTVSSITGAPGKTSVAVDVRNRTSSPLSGDLRISLPKTWQTPTPLIALKDIPPGETKTTPVEVTWSAEWKADEKATIAFQPPKAKGMEKSIIPDQYHLRRASNIEVDGDLKDWPVEDEFPSWMLGSTSGPPNAKVYLAWAPEGLYGAVDVHDSRCDVTDPKSFWNDDALEFFISTRSTETTEGATGDHHFWLVPLFGENRAYLGQWKINNEIGETKFDIPGFKSALRKTEDGYIVEFLIPAALLQGYAPSVNGQLGLNLNFSVHGHHDSRAVYWPQTKASGVINNPSLWGRLLLTP